MKENTLNTKFLLLALALIAALALMAVSPLLGRSASAASLNHSYIRETRMKTGTTSDIRVVFKTVSSGATGFTIDFNGADSSTWTGNTGSVSASGMTVTAVSGCDASASAASGSPSASGSGAVLTVTGITALSAATTYCWDITKAGATVTNPNAAGEYHPVVTPTGGGTDTAITDDLDIVSNDQFTVGASVTPVFNLAISSGCASNQDNFSGALSYSTHSSTSGCTWTVNTNAANGWFAWAKDSGLASTAAGHTIAAASTASVTDLSGSHGTEGYGLGISAVANGGSCATGVTCGTVSPSSIYDSTSSSSKVGGLDSTLRNIASSTGPNNAATFSTVERANINATTPAATDYQDTITLVGAGYF